MKKTKKSLNNQFICGITLSVFFISILLQSLDFGKDMFLFPRIISIIGVISCLVIILQERKIFEETSQDLSQDIIVSLIAIAIFICMILVNVIGFYSMIFVIDFGLYTFMTKLSEKISKETVLKNLGLSLGTTVILFVLFDILMQLRVPTGILI